ncbi:GNAT family N-acetyltransferase [Sulfitobacter albidus]|uniref:GNAT family N-acetyltransferase n=1 Tax=Sulfitobacter albidus TaxID=2829501 RepID=A0A975JEA6_9RHOB|nr:GNAT family N-acetyltransferase [Sulfitobacter albidus]QUJ76912.1 GNAT family N-acetyltransferase [Sulfitobacter albidus]
MTAAELARIHAAAFPPAEAWSERAIADTRAHPLTRLWSAADAFALTRTVAGESELLTLATAPAARRRGRACGLLTDWLASLSPGDRAFLEVAADNIPARALYTALGFAQTGLRRGYYARRDGPAVDAVLMSRAMTLG